MKTTARWIALFMLASLVGASHAQPVLSLDFNHRTNAVPLEPGFSAFVIESNTSPTAVQTVPTVRTFDSITVTVSGGNGNPGYSDRYRTTPVNGGEFTQELLLRDFVFATNTTGTGGLNVQIEGLVPLQPYHVTLWSYDSGSPNNRVSDWYAQGVRVVTNYTFAGSATVMPTNNLQYQMNFRTQTDGEGKLGIQGRRVSSAQAAVFLNALQLTPTNAEPPLISVQPASVETYAGERAAFSVQVSGTPPFLYQWRRNEEVLPDATNSTLVLTNVQATAEGQYSVAITNGAGFTLSSNAQLTVRPVSNILTALEAHWPLDGIAATTPDATTNGNDLTAFSMTSGNLIDGRVNNALHFDGTSTALSRIDPAGNRLPILTHPSFSVAMWVYGSTNQSDRRVFCLGSSTNQNPLFTLGTTISLTNASLDLYYRPSSGSSVDHRHSTQPVFDNAWHHLVWVDDRGYARLYVDGVLDATDYTYTRGSMVLDTTTVGAVGRTNGFSHWFNGELDDVALWSRALTAAEVQWVMTNGPTFSLEPVRITDIQVGGGSVTLTIFTPLPANPIKVLENAGFAPADWAEVQNVIFSPANGNVLTATFALPAGEQKFYRVSQ